MKLSQAKQTIRQFLREHYTDERLAMLLAHAQSGKLNHHSCCCLVGVATWDGTGKLATVYDDHSILNHATRYVAAFDGIGKSVSFAFNCLAYNYFGDRDAMRRRLLIPMIRAEFRRRERERQPVCSECRSEQPVNEIQVCQECLSNK